MTKYPDCRCEVETEKAVLVTIPDVRDEPFWVPKSAIHDDSEVYKKDTFGELVVAEWFAKKELE